MTDAREHFEGNCDVCGARIEMDYPSEGIIDVAFEEDPEDPNRYRVYTWMRHYATAPSDADPDCAVYSSRVYGAWN